MGFKNADRKNRRKEAKDRGTIICTECNRRFKAVVPKGGDGSYVRPQKHHGADGNTCKGVYQMGMEL